MNRIPLSGDVIERAIPYAGTDRVAGALARDPALRSLPSDELARRLGTTRAHVENAIHGLVVQHTGHRLQVSGRSFDEAISDAGMARRAALSPEPLNEAAGFGSSALVRRGAGQSMVEHHRALAQYRNPGPAQSQQLSRFSRTRTGRRVMSFDARGYQTPPIPDLSILLLSDAFPVTRRVWSEGNEPTQDEIAILNWQHPLVKNASSPQSIATLKAISAGAYSWDTPATVGGNALAARTPAQRVTWWQSLQQIMKDVSTNNVATEQGTIAELPWGQWGLAPPKITDGEIDLQYWYLADGNYAWLKEVHWMTSRLQMLQSGDSVIGATWAREGAAWQIGIVNGKTTIHEPEGWDFERESMLYFSGFGGMIGALTSAVAAAVAVYCPACAIAVKIAANLAQNAAKGAVTTKALASFGDQMLTNAAIKARQGDSAPLSGLRAFAGSLIGLPSNAVQGAQPNGGLVYDYLNTLGTAPKNVAWALQTYAQDHSNTILNAATLATSAGVPLLDAQYAVAAMTDTLARFASNISTAYLPPDMTLADRLVHQSEAMHMHGLLNFPKLAYLKLPEPLPPAAPQMSTGATVAVAAGAIGLAWAAGLLKGF